MPRRKNTERKRDRDGRASRRVEGSAERMQGKEPTREHRLRGAVYDDDFDDAERDSSAVTNRRSDTLSDS